MKTFILGIIEDYLTHPKIEFGIPNEYYGEVVMAWIQLHESETATDQEIRKFYKDKIAHSKIPKFIWFVKEFPMTVTGKLQKLKMREMAIEQMAT